MVNRPLLVAAICLAAAIARPSAQSDLDALMSRVLERRDENWKKLQQYTLNERDTLQVSALGGLRLYGFEREYLWFPRAGFFIRSPLGADGVQISEEERRRAEDRWLRRSQDREKKGAERAKGDAVQDSVGVEDIVRQSFEPEFIEAANFLRFKFDQGQYALVGRERMLDRDVLRIEYYPTLLFRNKNTQPNNEPEDEKFQDQMNKASLVSLWVDPVEYQILRYDFRNIDLDFLPIPSLIRFDGLRATMEMSEPFPNVWLPASISMRFRMTLAVGPVEARYDVEYQNYRLATVTTRVR